MLLTLLLILALGVVTYLYLDKQKQVKTLTQRLSKFDQNSPKNPHEEFTLGLKKLNSEFVDPVLLDPLTGLPGQQAFNDRLIQTLNQSRRFKKSFAVILLDINEFKIINKAKGYDIGDKLLKEISGRLQSAIRQIDTMTRYAGDIFAFLLPELSMPETAAYVAQRLIDNVVQPFKVDDQDIYITASLGVSIFPVDGDDIKTLLENANHALHQAKLFGKSRYQFFRQEIHALGQREITLNNMLCASNVTQKLHVQYSPYVRASTNEIFCIQAIPYLHLAENEIVTLPEFSKVAENCGKLGEISEWLLKTSIMQFKKWQLEDLKPSLLSIQVTLRQIQNSQYIYNVTQILKDINVDPKEILFEIIDENLFTNASTMEEAFAMVNHLGIQISLSVSALGHLALQKITHLPINYLKISANMLRDVNLKEGNQAILHMIVTLAKDMNIIIMSEGVDNENIKNILEELGCEIMQGKLFAEPLPI